MSDPTGGWSAEEPTEPTETASGTDSPPGGPEGGVDDDGPQGGDDLHDMRRARMLRNENANLRQRAKDAEAQRDALTAQLDGYHRQEIEKIAGTELRDVRDLLDRHPLTDFVIDGAVSADAVKSAAAALVAERGHLAAAPVVTRPPTDRPMEGLKPGASPDRAPQPVSWADVFGTNLR